MCFSGQCKYENGQGECVARVGKGSYSADALCQMEANRDDLEVRHELAPGGDLEAFSDVVDDLAE